MLKRTRYLKQGCAEILLEKAEDEKQNGRARPKMAGNRNTKHRKKTTHIGRLSKTVPKQCQELLLLFFSGKKFGGAKSFTARASYRSSSDMI